MIVTNLYTGEERRKSHLPDYAITKGYVDWTMNGRPERRGRPLSPLNSGGPAFPVAPFAGFPGGLPGMTLRQWYVGQALVGLSANWSGLSNPGVVKHLVSIAVTLADEAINQSEVR